MLTCGPAPEGATKFLPVMVTVSPIEADLGLKSLMVGSAGTVVVGAILVLVVVEEPPGGGFCTQVQTAVQWWSGAHPTPLSHCSPPALSVMPSPQVERMAVKRRLSF